MIINIWSTPRTGSTWYTKYLSTQYPGQMFNEIFVTHFIKRYSYYDDHGNEKNSFDYKPGSWYTEYYLEQGTILYRKVYAPHPRTPKLEAEHRLSLIKACDPNQTLILHNHVSPMFDNIRNELLELGDRNIFLYRKDKRAQMYSFALALATDRWSEYDPNNIDTSYVGDVGEKEDHLLTLIRDFRIWDSMSKKETVAYEDMEFFSREGFPLKQNLDAKSRLSTETIEKIERLVSHYEKTSATFGKTNT